jgi:2'-5' RNA ligase
MTRFSQKYTIVSLLEDVEEGYLFASSDWPLHTTLIDTFATNLSVESLCQLLENVAKTLKSTQTNVIGDEYFGPNRNIHVKLIEKTNYLEKLHNVLFDQLSHGNLKLNDPQYSKDGYLPHVTVQKRAQVGIGDEVLINNLALIDMFPRDNSHVRKILKKVAL